MGLDHLMIIHLSVYVSDKSALLNALIYFNGRARGVCVVDPDKVDNATLRQYHDAGVRGVGLGMKNDGTNDWKWL
jgi:hypothetical protein